MKLAHKGDKCLSTDKYKSIHQRPWKKTDGKVGYVISPFGMMIPAARKLF